MSVKSMLLNLPFYVKAVHYVVLLAKEKAGFLPPLAA